MSMGWAAGRKLRRAVDGLTRVLAIELLTAARGLELRAPLAPGPGHRRGGRRAAGRRGPRSRSRTAGCRPRSRPPSALVADGGVVAAAESVTGPLH